MITFLGVAKSDGSVVEEPVEVTPEKIQVFQRPSYGFFLVVEGRPGLLTVPLGTDTFRWISTDPSILPDLQALVSNQLGDGSSFVCDDNPSMRGGVPAASGFLPTQQVADAINDLGCRFKDSDEQPGGRGPNEACTRLPDGFDGFYKPDSTVQFCALIDKPYAFPTGDTLVTVRIRDIAGILSEEARVIIRVP